MITIETIAINRNAPTGSEAILRKRSCRMFFMVRVSRLTTMRCDR